MEEGHSPEPGDVGNLAPGIGCPGRNRREGPALAGYLFPDFQPNNSRISQPAGLGRELIRGNDDMGRPGRNPRQPFNIAMIFMAVGDGDDRG